MGRKGISELIAAVMLMAIVVAIAGVVVSFTSAFTKLNQENVQNKTLKAVDCSGALIGIEEVFLSNGTSGTARVVVKNVGVVEELTIKEALLFNLNGTSFTANNTPIIGFNQGDLEIIEFTGITVPLCTDFSRVVVSTNCPDAEAKFTGKPVC